MLPPILLVNRAFERLSPVACAGLNMPKKELTLLESGYFKIGIPPPSQLGFLGTEKVKCFFCGLTIRSSRPVPNILRKLDSWELKVGLSFFCGEWIETLDIVVLTRGACYPKNAKARAQTSLYASGTKLSRIRPEVVCTVFFRPVPGSRDTDTAFFCCLREVLELKICLVDEQYGQVLHVHCNICARKTVHTNTFSPAKDRTVCVFTETLGNADLLHRMVCDGQTTTPVSQRATEIFLKGFRPYSTD